MSTDDLAAWLTQIWDEQEAAARAAYYEGQVWLPEEESVITAPDWDVVYTADRKVDARHIVEWQPSAALAQIEADRQLLVLHQQAWGRSIADDPDPEGSEWLLGRRWALHEALKLRALPHADRPGYREEWRP